MIDYINIQIDSGGDAVVGVGNISQSSALTQLVPQPRTGTSNLQRTATDSADRIIDVGDLPDGIIDVGDLPDGIIDVGDLPDGISKPTFDHSA